MAFCKIHGEFKSEQILIKMGAKEIVINSKCPLCMEKESKKDSFFEKMLLEWGIGERYFNSSFDNYRDDKKGIKDKIRQFSRLFRRKQGKSLIFLGVTGTGKTHLAISLLRELANKSYSVSYTTAKHLFDMKKELYKGERKFPLNSYLKRDLVVIDEIGITSLSEDEQYTLYEIIDDVYSNNNSIVLIGNLTVAQFRKEIGERSADRLREIADLLIFDWESERKNGRKTN